MLSRAQVQSLDEAALIDFLSGAPPEGAQLDYKRGLSGAKDRSKIDFLTDVSAFANAHGGTLILGVDEPSKGGTVLDRVRGVEAAEELSHVLERLCSQSIEPRIAGLLFRTVDVVSKDSVIVVHVPQSLERPHIATYKKERRLYVRHSESNQPMTAFEVRNAVLSDASREGRARTDADRFVGRYAQAGLEEPMLFMQAVPLAPDSIRIPTGDHDIRTKLAAPTQATHSQHDVFVSGSFKPTIDGVAWPAGPLVEVEVHANGYVELRSQLRRLASEQNTVNWSGRFLTYADGERMKAFGALCERVASLSEIDSPYLMMCRLLRARRASYAIGDPKEGLEHFKGPQDTLEWPEQRRDVGQDFADITERWRTQLANAFGIEASQM